MATIVDDHNNLDLLSLTRALQKSLPPFARPVFIRLTHAVDTTGIEINLLIQPWHNILKKFISVKNIYMG